MRRILLSFAVAGLVLAPALASDPWPDAVVSVSYGPGAGFGQTAFPGNILGPPDPAATPGIPSSSVDELLDLGTGGEIVLRFDDGGILDGPGPDFTVFENGFLIGGGPTVFTELGLVAVSEDGAVWHEFPTTIDPPSGFAGLTPTHGAADPLDPSVSGGDSFDLNDIGLAGPVRFVRIRDAGDAVADGGPSFDLDAIAVIHGERGDGAMSIPASVITAWPNPFNTTVSLQFAAPPSAVQVVNMTGQIVAELGVEGQRAVWDARAVSSGMYMVTASTPEGPVIQRVVKLR